MLLPDLIPLLFLPGLLGGPLEVLALKPNVVLLLTDDLDTELGTEMPMEKTRRWIHQEGVQVGISPHANRTFFFFW